MVGITRTKRLQYFHERGSARLIILKCSQVKPVLNVQVIHLTQGKQGQISYISAKKKLFWTITFLAETRLCLSLHFAFSLTCTPSRSFQSVTAKKFLRFEHPTAKKFLRFYHATAKKFLRFPELKLKQPAISRKKNSCCGCKKKFLRVHYFWAVL